jgi:hypothetical protein
LGGITGQIKVKVRGAVCRSSVILAGGQAERSPAAESAFV